ncbi:hypothetical protein D479_12808 [Halobacillus sp. BAB-2008]|nr:hypothetical protein D479_12808 [Halobacillus sp. BAB-2008]
MTEEKKQELKQRLLEMKEEAEQQMEEYKNDRTKEDYPNDSTGEISSVADHPGDLGTDQFERSKEQTFYEQAREKLMDAEDALQRMEEGTYGRVKNPASRFLKSDSKSCLPHATPLKNRKKWKKKNKRAPLRALFFLCCGGLYPFLLQPRFQLNEQRNEQSSDNDSFQGIERQNTCKNGRPFYLSRHRLPTHEPAVSRQDEEIIQYAHSKRHNYGAEHQAGN